MGSTIRFESAAVASSVFTRPPMHMPSAMNAAAPTSMSGTSDSTLPTRCTPNSTRPTVSRSAACTSAITRWKMTLAVANSASGSGVSRRRRSIPF